jgi:hypothetical protein
VFYFLFFFFKFIYYNVILYFIFLFKINGLNLNIYFFYYKNYLYFCNFFSFYLERLYIDLKVVLELEWFGFVEKLSAFFCLNEAYLEDKVLNDYFVDIN